MTRILVVEDSLTQAAYLKSKLVAEGFCVTVAHSGAEALDAIGRQPPHLVLTDLLMPGIDGLELVEQIRKQFPRVPTVLITEFGSEEVAAEALQRGAVGYIPKRRLEADLLRTLESVLGIAKANPRHQKLLDCWKSNDLRFVLDNDLSVVPHMASHLQDCIALMGLCDAPGLLRVGIALSEALTNAIYHGNLEVSSMPLERGSEGWFDLAKERIAQAPYRDRRVHVTASVTRDAATVSIRDEGPGFNPAHLPDPRDPSNLAKSSGRGLLLIRCFVDEVLHNSTGNEITLVKRREESPRDDVNHLTGGIGSIADGK